MKVRQGITKRRVFFCTAAILLIAAAGIGGYGLHLKERATHTLPNPNTPTEPVQTGETIELNIDWDYWKNINPDVVAWLYIPNTTVNYPVVQARPHDPDYYLTHDVYRTWNVWGCPYIDAELEPTALQARQVLIYGHHMDDGSMFAPISKYADSDFAANHRTIYLITPDATYHLEASFVRIVDGELPDKQLDFHSHDAFTSWYRTLKSQAHVQLTTQSNAAPEQVISLVTCSYFNSANERTIVYAQLT